MTFFRISQILKFLRNDNDVFEGSSTKFPFGKEPGYSIFLTWSVILGDIPSQLYTPCQREIKYSVKLIHKFMWENRCLQYLLQALQFLLSYKLLVLNIESVLRRKMQKLTHNVPLTQNVQCNINLVICNYLFPTRCNNAKQYSCQSNYTIYWYIFSS